MKSFPVLFYDGRCCLCHRWVQFVIKYETSPRLRFASLQSTYAQQVLPSSLTGNVSTVVLYDPSTGVIQTQSSAIRGSLSEIGGFWSVNARIMGIFPTCVLDFLYMIIAQRRYQWFGAYPSCLSLNVGDRLADNDVPRRCSD
ncbi:MAG: thiol-disulfide oxidoreductase DCC family protein [Candidatus Marinamargulisbacteria bacterium]